MNSPEAADWLWSEVGRGALSGVFVRGTKFVYTPRVGEKGYIPPENDQDDDGPAQVRPIEARELAARVDWHYRPYVMTKDGPKRIHFYTGCGAGVCHPGPRPSCPPVPRDHTHAAGAGGRFGAGRAGV